MKRAIFTLSCLSITAYLAIGPVSAQEQLPVEGTWKIVEEPVFQLGGNDPREEYTFHKVGQAFFLSSGLIAISDVGDMVIKIFDIEGNYVRTVGRKGEGPGEFMGLQTAGRTPEDGVWTWDRRLSRITSFDADGEVVATIPIDRSLTAVDGTIARREMDVMGVLNDDRTVIELSDPSGSRFRTRLMSLPLRTGLLGRDTIDYILIDPMGEPIETLLRVPGREWMRWRVTSTSGGGSTVPFSPKAFGALNGKTLIGGSGGDSYLKTVTVDATGSATIPIPADAQPVGREAMAAQRRISVARDADGDPIRRIEIPIKETYPIYSDLKIDHDGGIWIELRPEWGATETTWLKLSETGLVERALVTPVISVQDIGTDYVIRRRFDDFDLDVVTVYSLVRAR